MRLSGKLKDSLEEASQTTRAKHTFTLTSVSQSPPHERCSLASKDIFFPCDTIVSGTSEHGFITK